MPAALEVERVAGHPHTSGRDDKHRIQRSERHCQRRWQCSKLRAHTHPHHGKRRLQVNRRRMYSQHHTFSQRNAQWFTKYW